MPMRTHWRTVGSRRSRDARAQGQMGPALTSARTAKVCRFSSTACLPSSLASTLTMHCAAIPSRSWLRLLVEAVVRKNLAVLCILLPVVGTNGFGQNQSPSSDVPKNSRDLGIQGYGGNDISCLEWSDSCVTCRRDQPTGEYSCSNIELPRLHARAFLKTPRRVQPPQRSQLVA